MASLLDLSDIRCEGAVFAAAQRVQYNPFLPDGSTTDRMWATYLHAVMERMHTCFNVLFPWKDVDNALCALRMSGRLALPATSEHSEEWAYA